MVKQWSYFIIYVCIFIKDQMWQTLFGRVSCPICLSNTRVAVLSVLRLSLCLSWYLCRGRDDDADDVFVCRGLFSARLRGRPAVVIQPDEKWGYRWALRKWEPLLGQKHCHLGKEWASERCSRAGIQSLMLQKGGQGGDGNFTWQGFEGLAKHRWECNQKAKAFSHFVPRCSGPVELSHVHGPWS